MNTSTAEKSRQRAFDRVVDRILKARSAIDADTLTKARPNPVVDRLSAHLNTVWQACRAGEAGLAEFAPALRDWEEESLLALDTLAKGVLR